ncbi:MAG: type II secretion system F family protein [Gammaproteobacteria bacterium]|nr:type II secretion system F family protein [Gammaproteobacteria bacterium]
MRKKILAADINEFLRELALLLKNNIPLDEALEIVQQGQEKPAVQRLINKIQQDIRGGATLAQSLDCHPQYFQPFLTELVRDAEQRNDVVNMLEKIAAYRESAAFADMELAGGLKAGLVYPVIMLLITFFITAILMIFVVPVFTDMFRDFGAALPGLTQLIVNISDAFNEYWYLIFIGLPVLWIYYRFGVKRKGSQFWLSRLMMGIVLRLPGFGRIHQYIETARALRTWTFMLANGYAMEKAVAASAQATNNPLYADALTRASEQMADGNPLSAALGGVKKADRGRKWLPMFSRFFKLLFSLILPKRIQYFPQKLVHMVMIGEKAGQMEFFFGLADFYARKARLFIGPMLRIFNVFILILLWIIIGSLVIGMYLPIFKMGQVV